MRSKSLKNKIAVAVVNWNTEDKSIACVDALMAQTTDHTIIAVDNGSEDGFVDRIKTEYPKVQLLANASNLGFAGGVNTAIRWAQKNDFEYIALINSDALPAPNWLEELMKGMKKFKDAGAVTGKFVLTNGLLDSTGDQYTIWGRAYPRGRDLKDEGQFDKAEYVFGASGGASLYKMEVFNSIGLFDEDFFAYYEDVDMSFRMQLAGWKVGYMPSATADHIGGASSGRVRGLVVYLTIKNLPWLFIKNVPTGLMWKVLPRFILGQFALLGSSLSKGYFVAVIKGSLVGAFYIPKKLYERIKIQRSKTVSTEYISSIMTHDLPPNAHTLRRARDGYRKLRGKEKNNG